LHTPSKRDYSAPISRWIWRSLIGLAVLALVVTLVIGWVPPLFVDRALPNDSYVKAVTDVRTALLQLLAGVALFAGLWFTGQTYRLSRDTQRTERFAKAVEAVGNKDSETVRAGGIYILWMLAVQSGSYWDSVERILSGFVREKAKTGTTVGSDVQAALTVIGKRPARGTAVTLIGTSLIGADLSSANLNLVVFDDCNLTGATFRNSNLVNASLRRATADTCRLFRTDLTGASFEGASLIEANFFQAIVKRTDFDHATMTMVKNFTKVHEAGMVGTPTVPPTTS